MRDSYARKPKHYPKELFKILDRTFNWIGRFFFFWFVCFIVCFSKQRMVSMRRRPDQLQSEEATSYLYVWIMLTCIVNFQE